MREARIILPINDNNGNSLSFLHKSLAGELCRHFGGATATQSNGMWIADNGKLYDEPGIAYDIAMEPTRDNDAIMREIAVRFGRLAEQEAMYLRLADGQVDIINTSNNPAQIAA